MEAGGDSSIAARVPGTRGRFRESAHVTCGYLFIDEHRSRRATRRTKLRTKLL